MMPERTAQDTPSPTRALPEAPISSSAATRTTHSPAMTRSGQFSRAAAATVLLQVYTKQPNRMAMTMMKETFLKLKLNSSAAWGMASNPTYAQGAIAKVARMAPMIPAAPWWAYRPIPGAAAPAAIAASLSNPQIGSIWMPFALLDTKAAINSVNTQTARRELSMVCTTAAFCTPMMFSQPKSMRMADASSISPM